MNGRRVPSEGRPPFLDGAAARRAASVVRRDPWVPQTDATAQLMRPALETRATLSQSDSRESQPPARRSLLDRALSSSLTHRDGGLVQPLTSTQAIRSLRMRFRGDEVDEFGLDRTVATRWRPWLSALYQSYWHVSTKGTANVPDRGPALIVANHGGVLPFDVLMLTHSLAHEHPARRVLRPLIDDGLFHAPFVGALLNRLGCVRACQDNAMQLLQRGEVVLLFPEGSKGRHKPPQQRHRLQRFGRGGFIKLALRTATPIVPAAVLGAEETLGAVPLPGNWKIQFAPKLELSRDYPPEAENDPILVARLTEQVRRQIQEMLEELRKS